MKLKLTIGKKLIAITLILGSVLISQSFAQQGKEKDHDDAPTNLKVLPKNTSDEDLHKIMKGWSKSLGVRCGFCHEAKAPAEAGGKPKLDFASDAKEEKTTAREMFKMTEAINEKFIGKMKDKDLEKITCVTCHMGSSKPMISVDSLKTSPAGWPKGQEQKK